MKKFIATVSMFAPALVLAQAQAPITNADTLVAKLVNLSNTLIGILTAFAVLWIIYNVILFIVNADNQEKRSEKGKAILWGIVGLAIILSIWGLVKILTNTFNLQNQAPTPNELPQLPPIQRPN